MTLSVSVDTVVEESDSPLLDCHESWERVRLSEIAETLNGNAFTSDYFVENGGIPLLRIRDIGTESTEKNFSGDYDDKYLVHPGDIVIGMDGDFVCEQWRGPKALLNQRVCKVTPSENHYNKKFLAYVLQPYLDAIHARTSSTTVKHLSSKDVQDIPLPLPPLDEQKRIVEEIENHFSKIDTGISELEYSKAKLQNYKMSVIREALEGDLTDEWRKQNSETVSPANSSLSEIEDGPTIPPAWEWVEFKSILREKLRNGYSAKKAEEGIRTLTLTAVTERDFSEKNTKITEAEPGKVEDLWLESGDILIERSNTEEYVGLPAVYRGESGYAIFPDLMIRARVQEELVIPEYADYVLLSSYARNFVREKSKGTSGSMSKINQKHVREFPFPLAPIEEQKRIVEILDKMMEVIDKSVETTENEIKRGNNLRQSILEKAFNGELVPQNQDEASAESLLHRIKSDDEQNYQGQIKLSEVRRNE